MGVRLGKLRSAVADLEKVLVELKAKQAINEPEAAHVQQLNQIVTKRWESLDDKWEELEDEDDNFKDDDERNKCQSDYEDGKKTHQSILNSTREVLSLPRATTTQPVNPSPSGAVKIEDTLKPRELLSADMSLEEANLWFDAYHAHIGFNKANMAKLDIKVRRAMLNGCLDTRMASALRTHKKITAETEINTPDNGCLDILR